MKKLFSALVIVIALASATFGQKTVIPVVYTNGVPTSCVFGKIYVNYNTGIAYAYKLSAGCVVVNFAGGTFTTALLGPDGAVGTPTYSFTNATNTGAYRNGAGSYAIAQAGADNALFSGGTAHFVRINLNSSIGSAATLLESGGTDVLDIRRGVNPQRINVANTYTSGSNREDLSLYFASNIAHIGATTTGATARTLQIDYGGTATSAISIPTTSGSITFGGGLLASSYLISGAGGVDNVAWSTYTPTITSGTGALTTAAGTGRYKQIGKTVFVEVEITITTAGTGGQDIRATLPINSATNNYVLMGFEWAVTGKSVRGFIGGLPSGLNNTSLIVIAFYDNTYPGASGNKITLTGVYEVP